MYYCIDFSVLPYFITEAPLRSIQIAVSIVFTGALVVIAILQYKVNKRQEDINGTRLEDETHENHAFKIKPEKLFKS